MAHYIHLLSNGSQDAYPHNSLTNFTNKFPIPLDIDQNYEIGIQSFGYSSKFRNLKLPNNPEVPSIIILKCEHDPAAVKCTTYDKDCNYGAYTFNFDKGDLRCINNNLCMSEKCIYRKYFLPETNFDEFELEKLGEKLKKGSGVSLKAVGKHLTLTFDSDFVGLTENAEHQYRWVFLHNSFNQSFKFSNVLQASDLSLTIVNGADFASRPEHAMYQEMRQYFQSIGGHKSHRDALFKDNLYCVYLITRKHLSNGLQLNNYLKSQECDLSKQIFPKHIKVTSDNIRPQILNSKYSKDLLVFSPDYNHSNSYTLRDVKTIDFVPLLNNTLSSFNIKLLDENDNQLQILSGTPTIVKLVLKKMPPGKESFNVRLTSSPNKNYPLNTITHFKVALPTPLLLDKSWKVSLNSISHPTNFSTFLNEEDTRTIMFHPVNGDALDHIFQKNHIYDETEIVEELNEFLTTNNIGNCAATDGRLNITIAAHGTLTIHNCVAKVLGYKSMINENLNLDCYRHTRKIMESQVQLPEEGYTFAEDNDDDRRILFARIPGPGFANHFLKLNYIYTKSEIVSELNAFLNENKIGDCQLLPNGRFMINLRTGRMVMGKKLSMLLGSANTPFKMEAKFDEQDPPLKCDFKAEGKILLNILKPSYIMAYSNIVQSTVVGGVYNKLLRLAPTPTTNLDYIITEFEHKEFYDLENSEIDAIDIMLCAHDGRAANFISGQDIIVNLEFSNYQ